MKIPNRFQVFDRPVVMDSKDEERLTPYLTGWMKLAGVLSTVNEPDLERLVLLELLGKQRKKLIDRLLMRLGRVQRKRIERRIAKLL